MLEISNRARNMQPSATLELTAKVAELREQGIDIIAYNVGEPDFETPQNIRDACKKALDEGRTKYTAVPGIVKLRQAICNKLQADNGVSYKPSQICYGTGAKQPIFNALFAVVNEGEEVIIPTPCWVSYIDMVKLCDGVPVLVPCRAQEGFTLDVDAIAAAVTPKTKAIIINNPNNPTGCVYSEESLRALAALALEKKFYIISDEVYEKLIYDGLKHFCIAAISEEVKNITLLVNGFSKAYSMTGWRAGYVAGPQSVISKISGIQGHTTSNATTFVQYACIEALEGPQEELRAMVVEFDKRRRYMSDALRDLGMHCLTPTGAFYIMPDVSKFLGKQYQGKVMENTFDLCNFLLEQAHVAIVPGEAFEMPGHVRISYSNSLENLKTGVGNMKRALALLQD